jgi:hypothetical protein
LPSLSLGAPELSASPSPPPPWGMPGVVGCCGGTTGGGATVGGVAGQEEGATVGGVAGVGGAAAGDVGGTVTGGTASSLVASLARQTCSTGPPDRLSTSHSAHGHDGNDYASQGTRRMFHPTHALRTDCDSGASAPGRPSERQVPSNPSRSRARRLPAPSRAKEMSDMNRMAREPLVSHCRPRHILHTLGGIHRSG